MQSRTKYASSATKLRQKNVIWPQNTDIVILILGPVHRVAVLMKFMGVYRFSHSAIGVTVHVLMPGSKTFLLTGKHPSLAAQSPSVSADPEMSLIIT